MAVNIASLQLHSEKKCDHSAPLIKYFITHTHTHTHTQALLRATEGDDYTSFRRNLTFNPEDRLTPHCTSTAIMNDTLFEGTESFPVVLEVNYPVTITTDNTRVDIIDDDGTYKM